MATTTKSQRYEVVRGDDGFFVRHIAANGIEIARSSQVYASKRAAQRCRELMASSHDKTPVRDVDERGLSS